ncbi:hypothetical protein LG290_16635 (plasmid) [Halomonas sediminis]
MLQALDLESLLFLANEKSNGITAMAAMVSMTVASFVAYLMPEKMAAEGGGKKRKTLLNPHG